MSVEDSPTSTAEVDDVANQSESALRDNIAKKGKNAYYYAHAHKATGPKWDGKIEPRLLSTSSSNLSTSASNSSVGGSAVIGISSSTTSSAAAKAALMAKSNITNYAFLNETTKVKIYVNLPGVGNCQEEDIALDFTERTLCLTIKNYVSAEAKEKADVEKMVVDTAPEEEKGEDETKGEDRCLAFGQLFGDIENATFRKKPDKVIITLKKKEQKAW
eukprot:CAMPEP_0183708256 /NCGR_PEP_ID=MMETSP0737-20130205/4625_1 /TAXON_ID=385413 /ORGANISM="Thalassiosira miniscula, Strain CCMP1093" /LENGTH=216 /DNA_ID=CAMNT_0025936099 /DNA_START=30 /DNA_END=677 /DNA_ORIENTATION=-